MVVLLVLVLVLLALVVEAERVRASSGGGDRALEEKQANHQACLLAEGPSGRTPLAQQRGQPQQLLRSYARYEYMSPLGAVNHRSGT